MKIKTAVAARILSMSAIFVVALSVAFGAAAQNVRPGGESKDKGSAPATAPPAASQPAAPAAADKVMYVQFTTNKGSFVLELNHEKAPVSVDNFLKYVDDKFYNDTIFHRITKGGIFVIQGGGMDKSGSQKKTNPPIKNEWKNGLTNVRGSISMARTSAPDSATSQFFINVQDDPALDQPNGGAAYAVFGKVYAGMKTIDALYATPVQASRAMGGEVSQPVEPLIVEKAERITAAKAKELLDAEKPAAAAPAATQPAKGGH